MIKILPLFAAEGIGFCYVCQCFFIQSYKSVFLQDKTAPWEEQTLQETRKRTRQESSRAALINAAQHWQGQPAALQPLVWEKPKLAGSLFIFCLSLLLTSTIHASGANGFEMIREKCLYQILLLRIILRLPNKQDLLKALPIQKQQKICFQKGDLICFQKGDLKRPARSIVLSKGSWFCLFGDRTSLPLSWDCCRA